ncbi:WhiB family transcriptional regulator [Streptomyces sp. NBC_01233]|uniref:WhiB family transcriptional regulator n=1 Tax=Streptomyces sp. NBC_01233 TaxID=2903787 RepID=UPI002E0EBB04|nr:WhiB family transcriptional regulator [Streptomyces sp. NBC_01233]
METLLRQYEEALEAVIDGDMVAWCTTADPVAFHPEHTSGLRVAPYGEERIALRVCAGCPLTGPCLLQELREVQSADDIKGVRGGLRQSERRALYEALAERGQR